MAILGRCGPGRLLVCVVTVVASASASLCLARTPEAVTLSELPLPPPAGAGCLVASGGSVPACLAPGADAVSLGGFMPGGKSVLIRLRKAGSQTLGGDGDEIVLVHTDGTRFANGSPWKCVSCGKSHPGAQGMAGALDEPQVFADGSRALSGLVLYDCRPFRFDDERCSGATLKVRTVEADWTAEPGLRLTAIRLHPDGQHVSFGIRAADGANLPYAWVARLETDGPRAAMKAPQLLFQSAPAARYFRIGKARGELEANPAAIEIETVLGFSVDGTEAYFRGLPWNSGQVGLFAIDLGTGSVRRLASGTGTITAVTGSPDSSSLALGDARASGQRDFLSRMPGIPPLTDLVTIGMAPVLARLDRHRIDLSLLAATGESDADPAKILSASSTGWSVIGTPAWSPDGTAIAALQQAAAVSRASGGRALRLVLIGLRDRPPAAPQSVKPMPDVLVWASAAAPSLQPGDRAPLAAGRYKLAGAGGGEARIVVTRSPDRSTMTGIAVRYSKFASSKGPRLNGEESASYLGEGTWVLHSNLARDGAEPMRRLTGPDGYIVHDEPSTGTVTTSGFMATTVGPRTYLPPAPGP